MKILYGYPSNEGYNNRQGLTDLRVKHIENLSNNGFNVKPFNMHYSKEFPTLHFNQLDKKWKWRDKKLMLLYERFLEEIEGYDVFYNSVGINFHPEFIETVPQFTVFGCNDDPESSDIFSRPVASSYDMSAIGNVAEIDTYKSWGVKNVVWQPMGFTADMYDPNLTYEKIIMGEREIPLFMVIDKLSRFRRERMDIIDKAFPDAHFYGRGWKRGFLPMGQEVSMMQNTKIGFNIHNSTGPINTRLFYLPANGVLQICDNKSHLSKVYKLGEEAVGFDNVNEAIELYNYYINNDEQRRLIAAEGWKRAINEYNEIAVFQRLVDNIKETLHLKKTSKKSNVITLKDTNVKHKLLSSSYNGYLSAKKIMFQKAVKIYRWIKKR